MIGHFCGVTGGDFAAAIAQSGLLIKTARSTQNGHSLKPITSTQPTPDICRALEEIADPERPIAPPEFPKSFVGERPKARRVSRLAKVIAIGILVVLMVLVWRLTPLSELTNPEHIRDAFADVSEMPMAPAIVLAIFLVGGLLAFPVTLLIAATAATFGPWLGFAYAAAGAIASAVLTYGVGALIGRQALEDVLGPRLNRIRRAFTRRGVLAVATVRMVPIAPFTLVNLAAGASRIPLSDYVLGTMLGLLPGLILMSALGHQIFSILIEPTPLNVACSSWP